MTQASNAEIMKAIAELSERMERRFASAEAKVDVLAARLDGIDKRLDDQNAILAALIPAKIAAVGRQSVFRNIHSAATTLCGSILRLPSLQSFQGRTRLVFQ